MASLASQTQTSTLLSLPAEIRTRIWSLISEDYHFEVRPDLENGRILRDFSALQSILRSCQLIQNEAAPFLTISTTFDAYELNDIWLRARLYTNSPSLYEDDHYLWTTIIPKIRSITITKVDLDDIGLLEFSITPVLPQAKSLELLVVGTIGLYGIQPQHQVDTKDELYDFLHGRQSQTETSLEIQGRKTMESLDETMVSEDSEDEDQVRANDNGWEWLLNLMYQDTLHFRLCVLSIMHVSHVYYDKKSGERIKDLATSVYVVSVLFR